MKVCPECDGEFEGGAEFCPNDGARLRTKQEDDEATDPLIGRLLDGRWRIDEKFSEGGMGSIYLASQKSVDRRVAIKTLRPSLSDNDEFTERFFREARVTSTINHPHCVTIHDFGQTDNGTLYLVMEFLEGEPLADRMDRGAIELLETLTIGKQIASALAAAHERDIVHRDLKPDNIFLLDISDGSTFCKVLDFGISKDLSEEENLTKTGELFGTPQYMSPEQSEGGDLDGRTDVYSLGCILYEMLTGRAPFEGDTAMSILVAHVQEDVPPIREATSRNVPPEVSEFVMTMLEKDPDDRPDSAARVGQKLEELLSTLSVEGSTWDKSLDSLPGGAGAANTGEHGPADGGDTDMAPADISTADTLGAETTDGAPSGTGSQQATGATDGTAADTGSAPGSATGTGASPQTTSSAMQRNRGLLVWVVLLTALGFVGLTGIGGYYVYSSYTTERGEPGPLARWFGGSPDESTAPGGDEAAGGDPSGGAADNAGESAEETESEASGDGASDGSNDDSNDQGETESSTSDESPDETPSEESDDSKDDETAAKDESSDSTSDDGTGAPAESESGGRADDTGGDDDGDPADESTDDEPDRGESEQMAGSDESTGGRQDDGSETSDDEPTSDEQTTADRDEDDSDKGTAASGSSDSESSDEPKIKPATFVSRSNLSATGSACNKSDIKRTLSVAESALGRCYHSEAKSDSTLAGTVALEWNILSDGSVLDPAAFGTGSLQSKAVRDCVVRTIGKLNFAPLSGGRCYTRATFDFRK